MRIPSVMITIQSLMVVVGSVMAVFCSNVAYADDALVGDAVRGKALFETTCNLCHFTNYDASAVGAPGLQGVLERHDVVWLDAWIKGPESFAKVDVKAKELIEANQFGLVMPTLPEAQDDQKRADLIEYLKTLK